jgi:3-oxoacyl-[acyl-carrier protein] reductase
VTTPDAASSGPSALVTGASRGIGHGVALALAARGWSLTLVARDPDRLEAAGSAARSAGAAEVRTVAADLADAAAASVVLAAHDAAFGSMDAMVLAAGVGSAAPLAGYPISRYDKQFALNTRAPFLLVREGLPMLRAAAGARPSHGAKVVALASIGGVFAEPGLSVYGASTAALIALCRGVNAEESSGGVTATAIAPAYVDTDMTAWVHDAVPPETMIPVADVVTAVLAVLDLSPRTVVNELVLSRAGTAGTSA